MLGGGGVCRAPGIGAYFDSEEEWRVANDTPASAWSSSSSTSRVGGKEGMRFNRGSYEELLERRSGTGNSPCPLALLLSKWARGLEVRGW